MSKDTQPVPPPCPLLEAVSLAKQLGLKPQVVHLKDGNDACFPEGCSEN